jgi:hypothetical protein
MADDDRLRYLRIALMLVGVIFLGGIYPLMIVGIYATLGGFLIMAARNPLENLSLIWFTVWSSVVHATIMAVQSFEAPENHGHLLGDVPALIFVAVLLAALTPRGTAVRTVG